MSIQLLARMAMIRPAVTLQGGRTSCSLVLRASALAALPRTPANPRATLRAVAVSFSAIQAQSMRLRSGSMRQWAIPLR